MKNETKNAVIYVRTATTQQISIEAQTTASIDYANANNYNILKVFTDKGKSGRNLNRSAIQEMLKYCETSNNVDAVIAWRWGRLTHNFADYSKALSPFFKKRISK